jgi:hypothetical protein
MNQLRVILLFILLAISLVAAASVAGSADDAPSNDTHQAHIPLILANSWRTIMRENFDGDVSSKWTVFDFSDGRGEYYWNKADCRAFSGEHSGWAVGGGDDGRSLPCGSSYPDHAESWMVYGPFSLADASAAELRFHYWLNTAESDDFLFWGASINLDHTYGDIFGWPEWGDSGGWRQGIFDLTAVPGLGDLSGEPDVWVVFIFSSDGGNSAAEGAYLDDILLRKNVSGSETTALTPLAENGEKRFAAARLSFPGPLQE